MFLRFLCWVWNLRCSFSDSKDCWWSASFPFHFQVYDAGHKLTASRLTLVLGSACFALFAFITWSKGNVDSEFRYWYIVLNVLICIFMFKSSDRVEVRNGNRLEPLLTNNSFLYPYLWICTWICTWVCWKHVDMLAYDTGILRLPNLKGSSQPLIFETQPQRDRRAAANYCKLKSS